MTVEYKEAKPTVMLDHKRLTLIVRLGATQEKRQQIMNDWQRSLLHREIPPLIAKWESKLQVEVAGYFLQRMKTKWGSCNHRRGHIRLNTELVKKPKDLLEYVIVHEMMHLLEPTHNDRFIALLEEYYPFWREMRTELNELPLGPESWKR
ncbi:Putative predicted metal-dependent hydrolase [hydrothermal vent metagenome]|uniref:Predicted metal-dependent hydrolase n=1 Tax=hydrothermal vent metagenome TaxID=652676 RepID=A0A3B0V4F6_9ZZZZ